MGDRTDPLAETINQRGGWVGRSVGWVARRAKERPTEALLFFDPAADGAALPPRRRRWEGGGGNDVMEDRKEEKEDMCGKSIIESLI